MELSNPIGLAAGFDKDGEAIDGKSCEHLMCDFAMLTYLAKVCSTWDSVGSRLGVLHRSLRSVLTAFGYLWTFIATVMGYIEPHSVPLLPLPICFIMSKLERN